MTDQNHESPTLTALKDLLARIHRDGGQYTMDVGLTASIAQAHQLVANSHYDRDVLDEMFKTLKQRDERN